MRSSVNAAQLPGPQVAGYNPNRVFPLPDAPSTGPLSVFESSRAPGGFSVSWGAHSDSEGFEGFFVMSGSVVLAPVTRLLESLDSLEVLYLHCQAFIRNSFCNVFEPQDC